MSVEFKIKGIDFYSKKEIFSFIIKDNFSLETGIVLGEIYKYKEQWKFNPVASGYFGGLSDLCNSFGIEAFEETETEEEEKDEPAPSPMPFSDGTMPAKGASPGIAASPPAPAAAAREPMSFSVERPGRNEFTSGLK